MTQTTEHKKITPGDEEFWSERGIDFHVRLARPYVRYYPDDTTPVQDAYATLRTVGQKRKQHSVGDAQDRVDEASNVVVLLSEVRGHQALHP